MDIAIGRQAAELPERLRRVRVNGVSIRGFSIRLFGREIHDEIRSRAG
jgi:hypothetical protein